MEKPAGERLQSLERGLAVIRAFDRDRPRMTLSEVARVCELSRATARRVLHTLVALGYVGTDGKDFALTPRVLDLGYAYLSSQRLGDIALPHMEHLSQRVNESVSAAVLDGADIVYVARVATQRIMTLSLSVGSRLPALWTSMGRAILSGVGDDELERYLGTAGIDPPTAAAARGLDELRAEIAMARERGYALVDQELEVGVRSVAAPLHDHDGRVVAAMNVSTAAARATLKHLRNVVAPELLEAAANVDAELRRLA